jgi:DNA processing protein
MDPVSYYVAFNEVGGIGPARIERLIAACGSIEAAWRARPAQWRAAGLDDGLIRALQAAQARDPGAALARVVRAGILALCREDARFPAALTTFDHAPALIYVRGMLIAADDRAVAIVGTRNPSEYGREVARQLAGALAGAGVTIVSGLALGIDAIAHQAALDAGGRTIAVLACGADQVYPLRHRALAEHIATSGALVSEFPVGQRPLPALFPARNRLISGLAQAVVVIEADLGSGALITVDCALDQGREVGAVPGSIFSERSRGTHRMLRDGAHLITTADDVLALIGMPPTAQPAAAGQDVPDDPLERAVLAQCGSTALDIDTLAELVGATPAALGVTLSSLEIAGLVRRTANGAFVRSTRQAPRGV